MPDQLGLNRTGWTRTREAYRQLHLAIAAHRLAGNDTAADELQAVVDLLTPLNNGARSYLESTRYRH